MYIGTEFRQLFAAASPPEVMAAVDLELEAVSKTDPPARAEAMAATVARHGPHLVGLQEVATWRTGADAACPDVRFDFLSDLLAGLVARGRTYRVAAESDVWALASPGASGRWVKLEVRNVTLAAEGVRIEEARGLQYRRTREVAAPGLPPIQLPRGWTTCSAAVGGVRLSLVNTHLEEATVPDVQLEQAEELLSAVDVSRPLVLLGDFNSAAEGGALASPTYERLLDAGLVDAWRAVAEDDDGSTWGQANDVANRVSTLDQRLDLVLLAGGVRAVSIRRVGHLPDDRTRSGLWPSDHAGLVADLEVD